MKKTLLITMLALLGMSQMLAQEYEYVPFVREGVKWVCTISRFDEVSEMNVRQSFNLEFKGDTIINGRTYKAMHKYSGDEVNCDNDTVPVYMREENKIVYAITPDGVTYPGCPVGLYYSYSDIYDGEEFEFCDFNDPAGFWANEINESIGDNLYQLVSIDTIQVGMHQAKRYNSMVGADETNFFIIDGVGYDSNFGYTLFPFVPYFYSTPVFYALSHVIENGEIIYKGSHFNPNAIVLPGDVDGDGEITIADANSVIDIVVMGGNAGHTRVPASDRNGDGEVTIADVNAIIDIILNGLSF